MMLYFSYGSNMSNKRLKARAPSASLVTTATLFKHDLRFHKKSNDGSGKCDALETGNIEHTVIGVVFEISDADKLVLDEKEGLGYGYLDKAVNLTTFAGEIIQAVTYYAIEVDPVLKPYHWYKHHVFTGAKENGLPERYTIQIGGIQSIADPMPARHESEMAIYANKAPQTPPKKLLTAPCRTPSGTHSGRRPTAASRLKDGLHCFVLKD